jgi:hypothetical protein
MPVLGIMTCEILELEFACILAQDPDIAGVTVIEDRHSLGIIEALESYGLSPKRIPMLRGFRADHPGRLEVVVRVMELALHNRKVFFRTLWSRLPGRWGVTRMPLCWGTAFAEMRFKNRRNFWLMPASRFLSPWIMIIPLTTVSA